MSRTARHRGVRTRSRWGRRTSVAFVLAGLSSVAAGATGMLTADAAPAPGSNFGSINIGTAAYGWRTPFFHHNGEDVEAEIPYARSEMTYGGNGHALTSVFWPGDTGGHGGDTLKLLTGACLPPDPFATLGIPVPIPYPDLPCVAHLPGLPDQVYENMNDNYRAEAQSGSGKPVVSQSNPGVEMQATAKDGLIEATTVVAGSKAPGLGDSVGSTLTLTRIKLTGPNTAVVDAVSTMRNVSLGGGALSISSVTSVAHAVTTGKKATGTASTTVQGMKVGGVPVTVDNKGIHIQGQGAELPSIDALNAMLKNAGFTVYVADPTKTVKNASVQVFSGQLVIAQDNPGYTGSANDTATVITLGGANITADSSLAYVYNPPPFPSTSPPPPATGPTGGTVVPPPTGGGIVPPPSGDLPPPTVSTPPAAPGAPPVLAAQQSPLPGGIAPGWVVAVLLGSGLVAFGLRRLPDELFTDRGPACTLGGQ